MRNFFELAKFLVKQNVLLYYFVRHRLLHFSFFLPHDKDYWAIRLLQKRNLKILDVGANDGISAKSFFHICKTHQVLSIEPNNVNQDALKKLKNSTPISIIEWLQVVLMTEN